MFSASRGQVRGHAKGEGAEEATSHAGQPVGADDADAAHGVPGVGGRAVAGHAAATAAAAPGPPGGGVAAAVVAGTGVHAVARCKLPRYRFQWRRADGGRVGAAGRAAGAGVGAEPGRPGRHVAAARRHADQHRAARRRAAARGAATLVDSGAPGVCLRGSVRRGLCRGAPRLRAGVRRGRRRRQAGRRTGGREPVHLPPAAGVHRHGPGVHVPALRPRDLGQGVHRQADQPLQVLRLRVLRQRGLGPGGHTSHERLSNRYKETQSSIEAIERTIETVLIPKPFLVKIKKKNTAKRLYTAD